MIDLDEFDMTPERSGSAKRIRSGRKRVAPGGLRRNEPQWRRELRAARARAGRSKKAEERRDG